MSEPTPVETPVAPVEVKPEETPAAPVEVPKVEEPATVRRFSLPSIPSIDLPTTNRRHPKKK